MRIATFALGRHLIPACVLLIAAFVASVLWWDWNLPTHVLGQFDARWVSSLEVISVMAGCVAVALVAPILPEVEAFAAPVPRSVSTLAAAVVGVVSTGLAPAAVWVLGLLPIRWVPRVDQYVAEGGSLWDAVPVWGRGATAALSGTVVGLCVVFVAMFGRELGLALALVTYLGLVLLQSHPVGRCPEVPGDRCS